MNTRLAIVLALALAALVGMSACGQGAAGALAGTLVVTLVD